MSLFVPTITQFPDENIYDYGNFTAKQKKTKDGRILEKTYLYSKNQSTYYYVTAFATFSSKRILDNFLQSNVVTP